MFALIRMPSAIVLIYLAFAGALFLVLYPWLSQFGIRPGEFENRIGVIGGVDFILVSDMDCQVSCAKLSGYVKPEGRHVNLIDRPIIIMRDVVNMKTSVCEYKSLCISYKESRILEYNNRGYIFDDDYLYSINIYIMKE